MFYESYAAISGEVAGSYPPPVFVLNSYVVDSISEAFANAGLGVVKLIDNAVWYGTGLFCGTLTEICRAVGDGVYEIVSPTGEVLGTFATDVIGSVGDAASKSSGALIGAAVCAVAAVVVILAFRFSGSKRTENGAVAQATSSPIEGGSE